MPTNDAAAGAGPLSRFVVLDLTRVRAGPTAVRQLADWGADVTKIEAPEHQDTSIGLGGARHGPDFQNTHRNKCGITLNLKHERGLEVFLRLVARADVVIENFRPDVKRRLGIDYAALRAVNPRIILASLSGYGEQGPYAGRPAFDQIIQGMGGLMSVTGLVGQGPVRAGIPIADLSTGLFGAIGILIALLEREASGKGQWVKTSLIESQIAMMDLQAARYLVEGEVPGQVGNDHPTGVPTGLFPTKDGHLNIAADSERMWRRLWQALGDKDTAERPEFATAAKRLENRDAVNAAIEAVTRNKTTAEWLEIFNAAEVPSGPVNDMAEVFADAQVQSLAMRHPVDHATLGSFDVVASPLTMSRSHTRKGTPAPERGQHTDAVLGEFGFSAEEIARLRSEGVL
ncbi:MAG: CoA transferase [Rhodospirillales bacterium]|jgi:formyl-CoA transferase|nr:CoA transferase [Rhodospirillales bacterium]